MTNSDGEFKGSTKEAITIMKSDIKDIKKEIKSLNKRFWILLLIGSIALIEKLPHLMRLAFAK